MCFSCVAESTNCESLGGKVRLYVVVVVVLSPELGDYLCKFRGETSTGSESLDGRDLPVCNQTLTN